jgi:hypothetical protein
MLYNAIEIVDKRSFNTRHYLLPSNNKIAITGYKWIDNTTSIGGCGAIDLVMYLDSISLRDAAQLIQSICSKENFSNHTQLLKTEKYNIPQPCISTWQFVKHYLLNIRYIPEYLINDLHSKSLLWSDEKQNCVFPRDRGTGAFLRGTLSSTTAFKQTIGQNGLPYVIPGDNLVIISEAPIDAISLKYYNPLATILATGGQIGFNKLEPYIINAYKVLLAQDNDAPGDHQAKKIASLINNKVERLRPIYNLKDWNEVLKIDMKNNNLRRNLF